MIRINSKTGIMKREAVWGLPAFIVFNLHYSEKSYPNRNCANHDVAGC